jgi:flagellar biosynthesis protein FliQ
MVETQLVEVVREAILSGCLAVLPVLVAGFAVALVAGLVQAATGIHEPIVGLLPRLAVMAAVLVVTLPWMVERLAELFRSAATGS